MIIFAAVCIILAMFMFAGSYMFERPWLKWWMIPFLLLAGAIVWGKFTGVI